VTVNDNGPFTFAFDTGSPTTVLDADIAAKLGISKGQVRQFAGAGEGGIDAWSARGVRSRLGGVKAGNSETWIMPLDAEIGPDSGREVRGLVGNFMGKAYTVEIDYPAGRLRVFDADRYEWNGEGKLFDVNYQ